MSVAPGFQRPRAWRRPALGFLLAAALGCGGDPRRGASGGSAWLVDEAALRGVDFVLESGANGLWAIPEIMSGGVAVLDIEGDGDLDLYFVQSGDLRRPEARSGNRLFENLGDGRFVDVSAGSGAEDRGWGMGAATGDFDGDGAVDLYVTNLGPNVLLRNRGDGRFEDVTAAAGVGDPGFSTSAAFVDYDLDGDLDLFTLNYLEWSLEIERPCFNSAGRRDYCKPALYEAPASNRLYRNRGDGTFEDVSEAAGIAAARGTSMGLAAGDLTGDGWPDVFVANDGMEDRLWVGASDGRFVNEAPARGCAVDSSGKLKAGMGVDLADLDDDGDLDLIVGNVEGETDSLFINQRNELFLDRTAPSGLATSSRGVTRFGLGFVDFDHDGLLDLLEVAGGVGESDPEFGYGQVDRLLRQGPGLTFHEVGGGIASSRGRLTSRGAAFGDLDGDGWMDAVVVHRDAAASLLINQRPGDGESMMVLALDRHGSPALGAVIEATVGSRVVRRDVRTAFSYLAASDPRAHFAFPAGQRPASLRVRWPAGNEESFSTGDAVLLVVREGAGATRR